MTMPYVILVLGLCAIFVVWDVCKRRLSLMQASAAMNKRLDEVQSTCVEFKERMNTINQKFESQRASQANRTPPLRGIR